MVLVRKKDSGMLYAMKIITKALVNQKRQRVKCERDIMIQLQSQRLIKLHWTFQTSSELFFVMELCSAGELFYHLQLMQTLNEPAARYYLKQVCEAIETLHTKNILYRDLKPENCLIDHKGDLKLGDFGLSKQL